MPACMNTWQLHNMAADRSGIYLSRDILTGQIEIAVILQINFLMVHHNLVRLIYGLILFYYRLGHRLDQPN